MWFLYIYWYDSTGVWNKTNIHQKAVFQQDDIYSGRSMSHVLGFSARAPGKYELKYKLSTLIEPFTKQRTSSWVGASGEIASFFFPQNLRELTRPEMAHWLGDCGPRGSTQTLHALRGYSCLDQFLLYDSSCQLTIGPEGHQMGVKKRVPQGLQG